MLYFIFAAGIVFWLFFNYTFIKVILDLRKDWNGYDAVIKTISIAWYGVAPVLCNVYMLYNLYITWSVLTIVMA